MPPKWGKVAKVKIELSPKRELNFQGPGHPQNDQQIDFFRHPGREGSREPSWKRFSSIVVDFGGPLGSPRGLFSWTCFASFFWTDFGPRNCRKVAQIQTKSRPKMAPFWLPGPSKKRSCLLKLSGTRFGAFLNHFWFIFRQLFHTFP